MKCRCSEIVQCICNMGKIGEIEVLSGFTEITNHSVGSELTNLAANCDSIFNCINMDDLMTQEKKLNEDVKELLSDLVKECNKKLGDLQMELSSMQREDSRYHEEERKKHHHHDDD